MNNIEHDYLRLLKDILDNGVEKKDRTGTGTISVFGRQIRHKMSEGFPLLTTKKMPFKTMVTELLWFLRGDTNIKYLVDNGCHIWDGDAYKNYKTEVVNRNLWPFLIIDSGKPRPYTQEEFINKIKTDNEFAKNWGELGPVYGKQWRSWNTMYPSIPERLKNDCTIGTFKVSQIDQIQNLINDLKTNPDSRRLMVTAWNPSDLDSMVLPPCHYGFQVYTRELSLEERTDIFENSEYSKHDNLVKFKDIGELDKVIPTRAISLMWNQRSVDTFLGLPFNIASYGLLLEIIAKEVNMVPDELIGNLGDVHLYSNHIEQAKEQIGRELSLEERTELAKGKVVPLLGSKEDSYNEAGIPTRTREPYPLPILIINDEFWNPDADLLSNLPHIQVSDFYVDNYQSHPTIKAPLSN
jgi:thymidylate synthase